jgi:hypothetical protein
METRGFPPPWFVEDIGAAFVVKYGDAAPIAILTLRRFCYLRVQYFLSEDKSLAEFST